MSEPRLVVLLSGRGSNLEALHDAARCGELPARLSGVISDRADARGLEVAVQRSLPARCVPRGAGVGRVQHEIELLSVVEELGADWICLAGYMRLLSAAFVERYPARIVNIHPSLLPAFPGLDAPSQAVLHGVRVSGCTVHLVDATLDGGPIVAQTAVEVHPADDGARLAARILQAEHQTYAPAVRRLLTEAWRIDGRRLVFEPMKEGA